MTSALFIKRLRKAKKIAMKLYPDEFCIFEACVFAFNFSRGWDSNYHFTWPDGDIGGYSNWVHNHCKSRADIALVFDNSIADRQREISEGNP